MSVVNQYNRTFVGQATANSWKFYLPQIARQHNDNYFEIEVVQLGIRRSGVDEPHDILFFCADIQGTNGGIITDKGMMDSRINLGQITTYDSGSVVAHGTVPSPVSFRLSSLQPFNPFTVTMFRLAAQELANNYDFDLLATADPVAPNNLVPTGTVVTAQFYGRIDDNAISPTPVASGNVLTVTQLASYAPVLAVGTTVIMEGFAENAITAILTGSGGAGTYSVSISQNTAIQSGLASVVDSVTPSQFVMSWVIREMSPNK